MKCITICQPWAEMILRGVKPVENRTWSASYRGLLLIHAGASRAWLKGVRRRHDLMPDGSPIPEEGELAFGAIVGVVDLASCVELAAVPVERRTPWHEGPWCWELRNARRFVSPVVVRGALGLWNYPAPLVAAAINSATPAPGIAPAPGTPGQEGAR